MTKKEIIELAREAEMGFDLTSRTFFAELERFANLVAAKERERCAMVCIEEAHDPHNVPAAIVARRCAEAIRSLK